MQHTRLIFLFAASCLAGVAALVACDSDDTMVPLPGGGTGTSSSGGKSSSGSQSGNPVTDDDDSTGDDDDGKISDAGVDCSAAPGLHKTTAGFYCAFYADGGADGGSKSNCLNDETCCNPGKDTTISKFPPSYCAHATSKDDNGLTTCKNGASAAGSTWIATGSTTWECGGTSNCAGGRKCCAFSLPGADAGNYINAGNDTQSDAPKECKPQFVYKIGGSKCADECADDKSELELCSSTDKCSAGKTCIPAGTTGSRDLGVCK